MARKQRVLIGDELMHPSDYLAAEDFKGKDVTLTIKAVSMDEVFNPKKKKKGTAPVLRFVETEKKILVSAKANSDAIAALYGRQAKEWVGKRVTFYPTTCTVGRDEDVPCIRVREKIPPPKGAKPESSPLPPPTKDDPEPAPGH